MKIALQALSELPFMNCAISLSLITGLFLFIRWWKNRHSWKVLVEPFEVAVPYQPSKVGTGIALRVIEDLHTRGQPLEEGHSLLGPGLGPAEDLVISLSDAAGHGLVQSVARFLDNLFPPHGVVLRGVLTCQNDGIGVQAGATLHVFDMRDRQIQALRTIWKDLAGSQSILYSWHTLVDQMVDWFLYTGLWVQYGNRGTSSYRAFRTYFRGLEIGRQSGGTELEKELAEYERSVAADKSFTLGQLQLATTLHRLAKHERARTHYEESVGRPVWLRAVGGRWEAVKYLAEYSLDETDYGKAAWLFHWARRAARSASPDNPDEEATTLAIYRAVALSMIWHKGFGVWGNRLLEKLDSDLDSLGWESLYGLARWHHLKEDRHRAAELLTLVGSSAPSDMWSAILEDPTWDFPEYMDVRR